MYVFLDSFDHYATADIATKYTQEVAKGGIGTDASAIASVGRRSTSGLRLKFTITNGSPNNFGNSKAYRAVLGTPAPSGATAIAGFAFKSISAFNLNNTGTTQTSGPCLFAFYKSGTAQIWFRLNTNGTISAYRGTTLLGTTSNALTQNVFQYIEIKVVLNGTTGTVDIRVDEVSWLALTGVNTQNAGVSTWDEIYIGPIATLGPAGNEVTEWSYDDLYVADGSGSGVTDFKGDTRIDAVFPNANGTTRTFTPSTGSDDFAVVDEAAANGDTDYLTGSTVGNTVTMNFPNAPVAGAQIHGLQVVAQGRKVDAGSAGHKAVTRLGGTDYAGTEAGLGSSYAFHRQLWDKKPSDSTAWTDTDFNAAEFGATKSS